MKNKLSLVFGGILVGISLAVMILNQVGLALPFLPNDDAQLANSETSSQPADFDTDFHIHFDLLAYKDSIKINLSEDTFQSDAYTQLSDDVHLHDGNGSVVHIHSEGVTLGEFFESLSLSFENPVVVVNGNQEKLGFEYVPKNIDQIIVYEDSESFDLETALSEVSDEACIYSETCPERRKPPLETCVSSKPCVVPAGYEHE